MVAATLVSVKRETLAQGAAAAELVSVKRETLYSLLVPPTPPVFSGLMLPNLAGMGWNVHKKPTWVSGVSSHVSGRSTRWQNYQFPIWEFQALWNGLTSDDDNLTGLGAQSLQTLLGFFLQVYAQADPWLFIDPSDHLVQTTHVQALGDGSTTSFTLVREMGLFAEPVPWLINVSVVELNGVPQPSFTYTLSAPNIITFLTPPAFDVPITAAFEFAFIVRCLSDQLDFNQFMSQLWELGTFSFRSVRYPF